MGVGTHIMRSDGIISTPGQVSISAPRHTRDEMRHVEWVGRAEKSNMVKKKCAFAMLLTCGSVAAGACSGTLQAMPPTSSSIVGSPIPTRAASIALQPTDTPKPSSDFLQPPLSAEERQGQDVAFRFVQAVILRQDMQARTLLTPEYSGTVPDLAAALGLKGNPDQFSVGAVGRANDQLIIRAAFYYSQEQVTRQITVARVGNDWKIMHIDPMS